MNKQVSYAYQHLSRTETLFKGENKNINISVSKNSPVNASLSLDGYKHSMVQIIALTIALKMKTVIVNAPFSEGFCGKSYPSACTDSGQKSRSGTSIVADNSHSLCSTSAYHGDCIHTHTYQRTPTSFIIFLVHQPMQG